MNLAKNLLVARRRQHALSLTNERQLEMGLTFNQRAKFAVWDRRTDLGETLWGSLQGVERRHA